MKKQPKQELCVSRSYLEAVNSAKKLQSELINLVDENLLTTWSISRGGLEFTREIEEFLDRAEHDSYLRLNPVCVNIIDVLRKICELNNESYRLRDLVNAQRRDK